LPVTPTRGWEVNGTARDEVPNGMVTGGGEAASLVESAMLLRWRAPELALLLADRAVAAARDDRMTVLRADHLAVFALNRLGRHGEAAHRLLPALRAAEVLGQLRHELQVELATCAAALGEHTTALTALHPVLAAGDDIAPVLRGTVLVITAQVCGVLGRGAVVSAALEEADELYREDLQLDRDTALLLRATASAVHAAQHRRNGAIAAAEAQARAGRQLLTGLADPEHDSGQVSGRLMLEIVLALLDRGEGEVAAREARPLLHRPVRAAAAGAVGWLRLALATRVHLAEGRHEPALALLADAVEMTQRHGVDEVLAECLEGLSHVHEVRGEFADALHCVRSARAAESRHRRIAETARSALLAHCSPVRHEVSPADQIEALLPGAGPRRAGSADVAEELVGDPAPAAPGTATEAEGNAGPAVSEPAGAAKPAGATEPVRAAGPDAGEEPDSSGQPAAPEEPAVRDRPADPGPARSTNPVRVFPVLGTRASSNGVLPFALVDATAIFGRSRSHSVNGHADNGQRGGQRPGREYVVPVADTQAVERVVALPDKPYAPGGDEHLPPVARDDTPGWKIDTPAGTAPVAETVPAAEDSDTAAVGPEDGAFGEAVLGGPAVRTPSGEPSLRTDPAVAPEPATAAEPEPVTAAEPEPGSGARRRRGDGGRPVLVSDLLPGSVFPAGRSGRRRAEDRVDESPVAETNQAAADVAGESVDGRQPAKPGGGGQSPDARQPRDAAEPRNAEQPRNAKKLPELEQPGNTEKPWQGGQPRQAEERAETANPSLLGFVSRAESPPRGALGGTSANGIAAQDVGKPPSPQREASVSGPPPAPTPRVLEWGNAAGGDLEPRQVGMGDLLAGALAAFHESHRPLEDGIDMTRPIVADAGTGREPTNQRGPHGRRTPGLQLALPADRNPGNAAEALTDPELRLPDLTAEPLWRPPGAGGRQSTAGD
jgi:hypothetical protein